MGAGSSKAPPPGGLRVHRVYPNGPGEEAGFEVFFDYILEANHNGYCDDSEETQASFTSYIASQENQDVVLNVYNARKKSLRLVTIKPRKWDGVGLLGLSVRFSEFTAMDEGAHVINVHEGSPASKAGLMPITDYLLGTNLQLFVDSDCVRVHVSERIGEDVTLYVYNSITETIRKTVIVPREDWGGQGTLGCDLGNGYIHRIPLTKSIFSTPQDVTEPEKLQEDIEEETLDLSAAAPAYSSPPVEYTVKDGSENTNNEEGSAGYTSEVEEPYDYEGQEKEEEQQEQEEEQYLPPSIVNLQHSASNLDNSPGDTPTSSSNTELDL